MRKYTINKETKERERERNVEREREGAKTPGDADDDTISEQQINGLTQLIKNRLNTKSVVNEYVTAGINVGCIPKSGPFLKY